MRSKGAWGGQPSQPRVRRVVDVRRHAVAHLAFELDRERLEVGDDLRRVAVRDAMLVPLVAIVDPRAAAVDGPHDVEIHVDPGGHAGLGV
ncbi:MAG: hypothetical protein ABGW82_10245, partial [Paracoccus sp. (in: a-proteobacteria)]